MPSLLSPFLPFVAIAAMLASALPLLVLGGWVQARWFQRLEVPISMFALVAVATSALLGYVVLLAYVVDAGLGRVLSICAWLGTGLVLLLPAERRLLWARFRAEDVSTPILAMIAVAAFYVALAFALVPDPLPRGWTWLSHVIDSGIVVGAPDHELPLQFATRLYDAAHLHHTTDRPPLQAGLALVPFPLWRLVQSWTGDPSVVGSCYFVFAVLLQCTWVLAVWALLRGLGIDRARIGLVLLALVPSYFFFLHSVYVWPKLLAGSFAVGAFVLLLCRGREASLSPRTAGVAASLGALAFLSHGGVATALLAFGLVLTLPRLFPGWRQLLIAAVVAAVLLAPWVAVVRLVAPPGTHIAKVHLAGVKLKRPDGRGTLEAIADAYARLTPSRYLKKKQRKARFVLGADRKRPPIEDVPGFARALRRAQFRQVFPSIDVLNLGWLVVPFGIAFGAPASRRIYRRLAKVLVVAGFAVVVWIAIFFSNALIQHASYATMILLFTALAAALAQLPRRLGVPVLLAHVLLAPVALLGSSAPRLIATGSLLVAAACYTALVALLVGAARRG